LNKESRNYLFDLGTYMTSTSVLQYRQYRKVTSCDNDIAFRRIVETTVLLARPPWAQYILVQDILQRDQIYGEDKVTVEEYFEGGWWN
jgi:hypothetical protein